MPSKLRFRFILSGAIFFALFDCSYACSCPDQTLQQQKGEASAVFLGKVVSKEKSNAVEKDGEAVTFKVASVWKGQVEREFVVYTGPTLDLYSFTNLCVFHLVVGESYVVFAIGDGKLTTDACTGTGLDSKYFRKELGKGSRPLQKKLKIVHDSFGAPFKSTRKREARRVDIYV